MRVPRIHIHQGRLTARQRLHLPPASVVTEMTKYDRRHCLALSVHTYDCIRRRRRSEDRLPSHLRALLKRTTSKCQAGLSTHLTALNLANSQP